jgi:nucleoside 2-deoxyribosyltransferase
MRQYKIYLSGPIASLSPDEAVTWRNYAQKYLQEYSSGKVIGICPMRNSNFTKGSKHGMTDDVVGNNDRIMKRCLFDVKDCDMTFVNVINAPARISMGTNIEVGFAIALGKPIYAATDKGSQYDKDVLFMGCVGDCMFYDLEIGLQRCCDFLLP